MIKSGKIGKIRESNCKSSTSYLMSDKIAPIELVGTNLLTISSS